MESRVECYAGASYPERPRAFVVGGERREVVETEFRERIPGGLAFRVRASDGRRFSLIYDEISGSWDVRSLTTSAL